MRMVSFKSSTCKVAKTGVCLCLEWLEKVLIVVK
jgi:hypothetical protein